MLQNPRAGWSDWENFEGQTLGEATGRRVSAETLPEKAASGEFSHTAMRRMPDGCAKTQFRVRRAASADLAAGGERLFS
ncbi:hypothetical protein [Ectobacillus ponti]|uniref:hypothetical protein n=1 Tax=Ectobacillus ponti TaxID=2961894 RepID=UPI0034D1770D